MAPNIKALDREIVNLRVVRSHLELLTHSELKILHGEIANNLQIILPHIRDDSLAEKVRGVLENYKNRK